ncbi:hypothetical protein GH714_013372 [Hevea brasiliensis]|uniref:Uncharacterized protein n=1 Tax=Hevea brasiliensis TaxID=3981 RepID=A0A6A6LNQ9_HEVBR|nr:hypothetical protein GH714_013372 [Hevea brasiliensis]
MSAKESSCMELYITSEEGFVDRDSEGRGRYLGSTFSSPVELTQEQMRKVEALRVKIRLEEEKVERETERQQVAVADRKMGVGKVGGSSEKWGASEAGGGTGVGGTERSNGRTREGDESGKLCKA